MSIKIEGGDGTEENVIKAGASNELLYNDKEVLLKEGLDLDLGLLPPDLKKAEEWEVVEDNHGIPIHNRFIVPEDGWIVKFDLKYGYNNNSEEVPYSYFINIDGIGGHGRMTPGQYYIGNLVDYVHDVSKAAVIHNLNCPYPVKKGQKISWTENVGNVTRKYRVIVTFAPCMSV